MSAKREKLQPTLTVTFKGMTIIKRKTSLSTKIAEGQRGTASAKGVLQLSVSAAVLKD